MKDYAVAFFISFGFSTGAVLSFYLFETVKSRAETIAYLDFIRKQMKEVEELSIDCSKLIDIKRKGGLKIKDSPVRSKRNNKENPEPKPEPGSIPIIPVDILSTPTPEIRQPKPTRRVLPTNILEKPQFK